MSRAPVVTIEGRDSDFPCARDDRLLRAALRAGRGFPYECATGSCGTCRFELLVGFVTDAWPDAPGLRPRDREKGRYLACQTTPRGPIVIRVRLEDDLEPQIPPRRGLAVLRERQFPAVGYAVITVELEDGPAEFLPGQFALIEARGVQGARAYSMSNQPNDEGLLEFHVKDKPGGRLSGLLVRGLPLGSAVLVDGPYGRAFARHTDLRPVVCIAGGSGLGPMMSIASSLARSPRAAERSVDFFYGVRGPDDVVSLDVLSREAQGFERWTVHLAASEARGAAWHGSVGMLHEIVETGLPEPWSEKRFYIAGPPAMVDAVVKLLLARGVSVDQMIYDRFY